MEWWREKFLRGLSLLPLWAKKTIYYMKAITFLLCLMLVESRCSVGRPDICNCLREEIEFSYKNNVPHSLKMRMLMQYDELDCDKLAPLSPK